MPESSSYRARSWSAFALKFVVSLGIVLACFTLLDVADFPVVLARTSLAWFAFGLLVAIAGTIVLPAIITKRALWTERLRLTLRELILINFAVRFYVLVLPRAASISIRWLRYRQGGSGIDALALMVYERLIQLFTMMAVASIALGFEFSVLGPASVPVAVLTGVATLLLGLALAPFLFPATTPLLVRLTHLVDRLAPAFVSRRAHKLLDAVQAFHRLPVGASGDIAALSLLAYAFFILVPYVLALAMQLDVSLVALAWIRPIVFLMTLLPFTVGGLGVREAGFIGLLHLYDLPNHEALALSLSVFMIQVAIGLIGAGIELRRYASALINGRGRTKEIN